MKGPRLLEQRVRFPPRGGLFVDLCRRTSCELQSSHRGLFAQAIFYSIDLSIG